MYSAADLFKCLMPSTVAVMLVLAAGCSGTGNDDHSKAEDLVKQAKECIEHGDYVTAVTLMDSVDRAYPREIEVRRQVMKIRSSSRTVMLEQQLQRADSIIADCEQEIHSLEGQFTHVAGGEASGFYVMKGAHTGNFLDRNAVEARVSDKDISYFIAANNATGKIGVCQIILNTSDGQMSSLTIPAGDSRRGDLDKYGTDLATFAPSEVDSLGSRLYHSGATVKSVTLVGSRGRTNINVSGASARQFADAWRYAYLMRKLRQARMLREKLERDVIVARDHEANLPVDSASVYQK